MTGFDGIREDTMPYVPRSFWQKWSAAIKRQYPRVTAVGEVYNGDAGLTSFFQGGRTIDGIDTGFYSLFDYPVYYPLRRAFAQGQTLSDLATEEAHDWLYPDAGHLMTFLGNHDLKRFMSEDGATVPGLELAQTFLLTSRGVPLIYYGDEIGMQGSDDPDNRRDFPGGFPGDTTDAFTAEGRSPDQQQIWTHVSALTHLRARLAPLKDGTQTNLLVADHQWVYLRALGNQDVIVALNNDSSPATVTAPLTGIVGSDGVWTDRLGTVAPVQSSGGTITLTLPAWSGAILTRQGL
jgi:glycosidase